ncbi:MAG: HAD hydrolase family protein [Bacteroidales bacterium]|jgi:3-deoxy-D-manno-octulosonate 8-phosphate phosphatase (KDO 8-P phosphatase)|nr:HAD hydrolase family protein [Bacteroidales bacterium]
MMTFQEKLNRVKAFAFDVDGVFSDMLMLHPSGELMRTMNVKDGYAVQYARRKGYPVAIITGGNTESIRVRFNALGVDDVYLRSSDKIHDLNDFAARYALRLDRVLYMGDDIPDIEVMRASGIAACPADASVEIKEIADYISPRGACKGCVRDVIEQTLRVQGRWMEADAHRW